MVPCGRQFESHCAQLYTKQIWRQMPPTRCSLSLSHSLRQWLAAARTLPNTAPNTSVTLPKLRHFVRPTSQRSQLSWRWALGRNSLRQRLVRNGRAANGREACELIYECTRISCVSVLRPQLMHMNYAPAGTPSLIGAPCVT